MKPTEQETDLSRQLIEKKSEIEREKTGLQVSLTGMEYGTQTTAHIAGQMSRAQKESLLRQQALGVEEANLISRLGLEEKKREGQITKAQTLLGYSNDDIELSFKIQDKLESQKKDYLNRVEKISENAKAKLDDLLEMFDGLDYNDLKPAEQQQLIELANSAGVPMDLLARGMKIEKDNFIYNRLQKEKTIEWSDPYLMGGDYVQRNLKTGEIRTAVNIPKGARGAGTELERMMKEFNLTPQQMVDTYVDAALSGMEVEPPASLEAQVLQGVMKKKKEMEEASKKPTEEVRSLQLPSARELGENVAALRYFPEAMTETVKGGVSSFWGKLKDFGSGVASGLLK
ncbi:MAG TPA: hypothetical protein DHV62_09660 [Elusimicrobia bacterium]|nr:hypothetical protein [Elusimicrobiota bacterium]